MKPAEATFADFGIPFPLYEAPASSCSHYVGRAICAVEGEERPHCFEVDALIIDCPSCGARAEASPDSPLCRRCGAGLPALSVRSPLVVGYDAVRDGRAAFVIDTELGMVTPALALEGRTHGLPGLDRAALRTNRAFELRPAPAAEAGEPWTQVVAPVELLWELVRTPSYSTWQGECWQLHCSQPMIFVGELTYAELAGRSLDPWNAGDFGRLRLHPDTQGFMTFRCASCGQHAYHLDLD